MSVQKMTSDVNSGRCGSKTGNQVAGTWQTKLSFEVRGKISFDSNLS